MDVLPSTYALVVLAGIVAVVLGLWVFRRRYRDGTDERVVPPIELLLSTPAPGDDVDRIVDQITRYRRGTTEHREQLRERLAEAAIDVIRHREDCSREEAVEKLESGKWTDDPHAVSFFAGGSPPGRSFGERLVGRITGEQESGYRRWVDNTIDAICELAEVDADPGATATEDDGAHDEPVLTLQAYRDLLSDEDTELFGDGVRYHWRRHTNHWLGMTGFALLAAGWGVLMMQPALLLVSVVAVAFAGYARAGSAPQLTSLRVERDLSDSEPQPGEAVQVTVRVHNDGDEYLPDLRMVDVVPSSMEVVDGSPRIATALKPGDTATFSYTLVPERGTHEWPLLVLGRDLSGSVVQEATIEVDQTLECVPSLATVADAPVRSQTSLFSGQVDTPTGGAGLEFFAVREYREGDPMKRIDWKRRARTGDLTTIDYRKEQAAKVVLLFDARESAFVSPDPNTRHALSMSVDAGMELFSALYDRGDLAGVAAYDTVPCWLAPSAGDQHLEEARQLFAEHPALSPRPPSLLDAESKYVDPMTHVRRQLSPETQVMLFSPLCDDYTAEVARRLDSAGHLVTVLSPDPTASRTPGERLATVERQLRVLGLREQGVRVLDWNPDELLTLEIERAKQRWAP